MSTEKLDVKFWCAEYYRLLVERKGEFSKPAHAKRAVAAFVNGVAGKNEHLVVSSVDCMTNLSRGVFTRMTGVDLPDTVEGTREAVRVWSVS